jgi:hypothetical protein
VFAVIFPHRAPLPFAQVRPPLFEGYFLTCIGCQALLFWIHHIKISIRILLTEMSGIQKEGLSVVNIEINPKRFSYIQY